MSRGVTRISIDVFSDEVDDVLRSLNKSTNRTQMVGLFEQTTLADDEVEGEVQGIDVHEHVIDPDREFCMHCRKFLLQTPVLEEVNA